MSKRRLKRQLNLAQVIMLGTAGTLAAEIFVLTGHAAGMAGPAAVLALLIGGLLSYSVALNYCELATTYPVAGGAMSYVREAFGNNILSFLVGSMDCMSSTFYAALSAVGFTYSLGVFVPGVPIVPVAIVVIGVFTLLNILGVTRVGNVQIILGGVLLTIFAVFIIGGLSHPAGFDWETFMTGGAVFAGAGLWSGFARVFATIALVYNAYVGFEVIADDAEEVSNPSRTIPLGILISLTLCTFIYVLVGLVTLGTVPWQELAGSETALTDAVRRFIPRWGVPMMVVAGMVATLTSINSAMLSATREAFTLGRDGAWPRPFSKLSRFRTPYVSILVIGGISALIAIIGLVDFLSYISSAGYLFVLFWGSLSMIRLRKLYPHLKRPFKAPLFPLTTYLAGASCVLIVAFADWRALLFGVGVLVMCSVYYYARQPVGRLLASRARNLEKTKDRILIPVANLRTAESLLRVATIIAQASEDTNICILTVMPTAADLEQSTVKRLLPRLASRQKALLDQAARIAQTQNVPFYTKMRAATSISQGILDEVNSQTNVKLILMGWPGPLDSQQLSENAVKVLLQKAHTNVAVLLDRGLGQVRHVLVPVGGGGLHTRMALRLAYEIVVKSGAQITALHSFTTPVDAEEIEDKLLLLREIVEDAFHGVPSIVTTRVAQAASVQEGILAEVARNQQQPYDLIVIGAAAEWISGPRLFGTISDWVANQVPCSVLLVRRCEPVAISWLRWQVKMMEKKNTSHDVGCGRVGSS